MNPLWIAALATTVLASACSKTDAEAPAAATPAAEAASPAAAVQAPAQAAGKAAAKSAGARRVVIETSAGAYWFDLARCSVGTEPGNTVPSYAIQGPGQAPDGQPVFVTVADEDANESTGPELRINVGTDQRLKTTDMTWISNDEMSHHLNVPAAKTRIQGDVVTIEHVVFGTGRDDRLAVNGPIQMDCSR